MQKDDLIFVLVTEILTVLGEMTSFFVTRNPQNISTFDGFKSCTAEKLTGFILDRKAFFGMISAA